jgi:predicted Rossmann fold flavoprotein
MKSVAIIGAGASGIMAGLFAARNNKVIIFEKQNKIGRKILSTGNGRCNISNKYTDISHYNGNNTKFVLNLFHRFGLNETIEFFESIGIPFIEENDGRLFPASNQALSVVEILDYELRIKGADIRLNRMIEKVIPLGKKFRIITAGREEYEVDSAIVSTGSRAHPQIGGSNHGYEIASSLGHKVFDPFPVIVPINIPLKIIHKLQGIKWNCRVSAVIDGEKISESTGELLFTKYGISGPAALNISRKINENMIKNNIPQISVDFFPDIDESSLLENLNRLWIHKNRPLCLSLTGILKKRMPEILLEIADINPEIADTGSGRAKRL